MVTTARFPFESCLAGRFGFCTNLAASMSVRFVFFGLLNGWLVLQGPCAIAVAGRERQTDVLGLIFAAGSGMQLVGPAAT